MSEPKKSDFCLLKKMRRSFLLPRPYYFESFFASWVFKDWLQKEYEALAIILSDKCLVKPTWFKSPCPNRMMIVHFEKGKRTGGSLERRMTAQLVTKAALFETSR
jgi:hypothetical protein